MSHPVDDLLRYIDAATTPYHAAVETARRLDDAGFRRLSETDVWELDADERAYVIRDDSSLIAFHTAAESAAAAGLRILGAHLDSPNLRVRPVADLERHGYRQLSVEPYGGVLLYTWLDRDLSLAGRVSVRAEGDMTVRTVDFARPLLRIPSLAIHLQREIRESGLKLNPQEHLQPVLALEGSEDLHTMLAAEMSRTPDGKTTPGIGADDILGFDLMAYDLQGAAVSGPSGEILQGGRLDNLASCHAALTALLAAGSERVAPTRMIALYDHEEVGSRSSLGAGGSFLADVVERLVAARGAGAEDRVRALARSVFISIDMAHAVHPNHADRHEPSHRPLLGAGPVIKTNSNLAYGTDAATAGWFANVCRTVDVTPQWFASRSDIACGSTVGPITAARVGIRTVDVGNPMLAMHSCREMAATGDVEPMIRVLTACLVAGSLSGVSE